jgi:hypothetical protein
VFSALNENWTGSTFDHPEDEILLDSPVGIELKRIFDCPPEIIDRSLGDKPFHCFLGDKPFHCFLGDKLFDCCLGDKPFHCLNEIIDCSPGEKVFNCAIESVFRHSIFFHLSPAESSHDCQEDEFFWY